MLEKIIKNSKLKFKLKTAIKIVAIYSLINMPSAIYTFTAPKQEIKNSLSQQLNYEMSSLSDISGGFLYSNFRLFGTIAGYTARKMVNK